MKTHYNDDVLAILTSPEMCDSLSLDSAYSDLMLGYIRERIKKLETIIKRNKSFAPIVRKAKVEDMNHIEYKRLIDFEQKLSALSKNFSGNIHNY